MKKVWLIKTMIILILIYIEMLALLLYQAYLSTCISPSKNCKLLHYYYKFDHKANLSIIATFLPQPKNVAYQYSTLLRTKKRFACVVLLVVILLVVMVLVVVPVLSAFVFFKARSSFSLSISSESVHIRSILTKSEDSYLGPTAQIRLPRMFDLG